MKSTATKAPAQCGKPLSPDVHLVLPSRWCVHEAGLPRPACMAELERLARCFEQGAEALEGLYLRLCDFIRFHQLQPDEAREALARAGMRKERVSEVLRVAAAPEDVYRDYEARLIGFRVALERSRLCRMVARSRVEWGKKKLARSGRNLLKLVRNMTAKPYQFRWRGWVLLAVPELNITNIVRIFIEG